MAITDKTLKIATVFSGIGAFEEALQQLGISHKVVFACDNGERELKFSYSTLSNICANLSPSERLEFVTTLIKTNKVDKTNLSVDSLYKKIFTNPSNNSSGLELTYDCIQFLTRGISSSEREKYVEYLYSLTNKENYVKTSYMANYHLDSKDWHEDIRFIDGKEYEGKVDIMMGGSPCQSFSTYGKKRGLEDTRGTLFYDYAKLIQDIKPKLFIYENVRGLLCHDKGRTWEIMKEVWKSLDYDIYFQVLDAQHYNLPQMRKRLFVVGVSKKIRTRDFIFPEKRKLTIKSVDLLEAEVPNEYYLPEKGFKWTTDVSRNKNKARINRNIIGCQTAVQQFNWSGDFRLEPAQPRHRKDSKIYIGKKDGQDVVVRKLMPIECLRLMGFKDFKIVVEDNVMYRQSGNSVAVPVLKALFEEIQKQIL